MNKLNDNNQQNANKSEGRSSPLETFVRRKAKVINCKYFKQCRKAMGGCKHPEAISACLYRYIDDCSKSERKYKLKTA